jgi:CheY-like chemotaxis protein
MLAAGAGRRFQRGSLWWPEGLVQAGQQLRKVLIICEESSTRDTMRVLLGSMGCQCVVASSVQQAIGVLEQENPDAAIVDPRSAGSDASSMASGFDKIYASLRGRILVLSGKESEPEVKDLVEQYSLPRVSRDRLLQELWGGLESLFQRNGILRRVIDAAHVVFDSFLEPMPAGVRSGSQLPARQLVYRSGSLMADLWLEPQTDSPNLALVGQIVDSDRPDRQFDLIPVVLHGPKGRIAHATTNKFGEFHFNFDFEPSVTLEIEVPGNHWVSVALPSLVRAQRTTFAGS